MSLTWVVPRAKRRPIGRSYPSCPPLLTSACEARLRYPSGCVSAVTREKAEVPPNLPSGPGPKPEQTSASLEKGGPQRSSPSDLPSCAVHLASPCHPLDLVLGTNPRKGSASLASLGHLRSEPPNLPSGPAQGGTSFRPMARNRGAVCSQGGVAC